MPRLVCVLLLAFVLLLSPVLPARAYTLQYTSSAATLQMKWPTTTINIALSTSLQSPPPNIKAGSDVVGAARRALLHWSEAANIQFNVTFSDSQVITPSGGADNESLISVSAGNNDPAIFPAGFERPGAARVFFDPNTGAIQAADLAINPGLQFSTDGTPNTYDLESTFTHEIGHMLGLEHSGILGASMQPRQGRNGTFDLPATTVRTLSDDDRAGMRAIYGSRAGLGALAGFVRNGGSGVHGVHVFAEEVSTGRVRAGNVTLQDGSYRIEGLPPGQYRVISEPLDEPVAQREIPTRSRSAYGALLTAAVPPIRTAEQAPVNVASDATTALDINYQFTAAPNLNPSFIGTNGMLSTVPVPLVPGQTTNVLVGGTNLHQVGASGISINSPYITVNQGSYQQLTFFFNGAPLQAISFDVSVAVATPPGEYDVRLQAITGEIAYVSGGLTMDLPSGTAANAANPIEDAQFFVAQHYRDFFNREPDQGGLGFWTNQITECGTNAGCREVRRINVSAAFFLSIEFQETGYLVYRFYGAAFGRQRVRGTVPVRYQEFLPDTQRIGRGVIVNVGNWQAQLEANKQAYANEFVTRPEFLAQYPTSMSPQEYVDRLNANTEGSLSADERNALVNGLFSGAETRATVLRKVAEDPDYVRRENNRAFVLMQYFGYLRRNPDDSPDADYAGYNFWLGKLNEFGGNYIAAEMVKAFITSPEYRRRFSPA